MAPAVVDCSVRTLAAKLPQSLRLGTSSWTFPGWTGLVYAAGRRGRSPSKELLAYDGLAAYARHPLLRTVGVDRSYYAPLPRETFARYASLVPPGFRFLVKADQALVRPRLEGGGPNPHFLDPQHALHAVVAPLVEGLGDKAGVLLFQFPPLRLGELGGAASFVTMLGRFLATVVAECARAGAGAVPRRGAVGAPLLAVELRNPELLRPPHLSRYLAALGESNVLHCFSLHPAAPELSEQVDSIPPESQREVVVRWMLRRNHRYEEAAEIYRPFDRLAEPDPASRRTLAAMVRHVAAMERAMWIIANNKAEGSSPLTLLELARAIAAERDVASS